MPAALWRLALLVLLLEPLASGVSAGCHHECEDCSGNRCSCPPGKGGIKCEFSLASIYFEHASKIYKSLHLRPLDLRGWGTNVELYRRVLSEVQAVTVVEVGVWKGASSVMFAENLKIQGHGVVLSVDTWLGALEFWDRRVTNGRPDPERDLHWRHGFPHVYYTLISNVVRRGLTEYIVPFPATSRLASDWAFKKHLAADFIHIDAAHEYESVLEDIKLWWRVLRPGGVMMGDDYSPKLPGVVKAADEYAALQNLKLHTEGNKWWLYKPTTEND